MTAKRLLGNSSEMVRAGTASAGRGRRGSSTAEYLIISAAIIAAVVAASGAVNGNWTTMLTEALDKINTVGDVP